MADLNRLTLAARTYAQDNSGSLPSSGEWCTQLTAASDTNREPPLDAALLNRILARKQCSYAINSLVAGQKLTNLQPGTIIFYPVTLRGTNLSISPQDINVLAWNEEGAVKLVDWEFQTHTLRQN